jgi:GNAT superfamily N-acetyltransferase
MQSNQPLSISRQPDLWITLLGILGFALFFIFYDQAFPSATLKLELSRDEIAALAESELRELGFDPTGYHSALTFSQDSGGSIYLQRTLGIPETNRLVLEENLPFYYWRMRWFQPLELEEFRVYLSPSGELLGFSHKISESEPGASLEGDMAEGLAGYFLVAQGWSLEKLEQISASSQERPEGRVDHQFTWERQDFEAAEATMRLSVSIFGDEIGYYNYWMKTPEDFWRDFNEQQNRARFINNLAIIVADSVFWVAAIIALALSLLWGIRSWRQALWAALLVGGVVLLSSLNRLPLYPAGYNTTQGYAQFWFGSVIDILMNAVIAAVMVGISWMGGTSLARWVWPAQDRVLDRGPDRRVLLARSAWRGLMMGGISLGYVILFYWVATKILGGWTPMQTGYSSGFATPFPFLGPLETGIRAAFNEELLYRLIGISLVFWLFRKRWLALLVPGVLWAFAHLSYIRDPFYMRGIELTIAAVLIFGLFFWKYGLLTAIIGHITINALLGALILLRSPEPKFFLSGWVVVVALLIPIMPGAVQLLRRKLSGGSPTPQPEIRAAVDADIDLLAAIPCGNTNWHALFSVESSRVYLLALDEKILGVAWGGIDGDGNGTIDGVYVDPVWRRQYLGTRLVNALSDQLLEMGAQSLHVSIETRQKAERAFWSSQGWRPEQQILSPQPWPPTLPSFKRLWKQRNKS